MGTQASSATIDQLIITSPYDEPNEHWKYDRETRRFTREPGRRPAGYIRASDASKSFDDPGEFVELPLVNKIRPRVDAWRTADYPAASGITRRLLKHWRDTEQREGSRRLFFCQLEAIETLMWLAEAPESDRVGIKIPGELHIFEDAYIKDFITGKGFRVVACYDPFCIHYRPKMVWTVKGSIDQIVDVLRFGSPMRIVKLVFAYGFYTFYAVSQIFSGKPQLL